MGLFKGESLPRNEQKLTKQALMNRKIIVSWEEISIAEICKSIFVWKKQLCLVVEKNAGNIEHGLK